MVTDDRESHGKGVGGAMGDGSETATAAATAPGGRRPGWRGRPPAELLAAAQPWFWSVGFPVLSVVLAVSVPVLLVVGRNTMLRSTAGALESQVSDPSAPGWRAFTEPTPTALVLQRDGAGHLVGLTLVSLTGADAAAVVLVPVDTVVGEPPGRTLAELAADGDDAVRAGAEQVLGLSPSDVVSLDATGWRGAVAPVAPLALDNPDDVFVPGRDGRPQLRFAKGRLALAAADVAAYLATRSVGERDLNRMARHEVLWRAWVGAVAAATAPDTVPGDAERGLARYVRALAAAHRADHLDVGTLPVRGVGGDPAADRYEVLADRAGALLARVAPFSVARSGRRPRIRLLDGIGTLHHGEDAATVLVEQGGQIDQVGNAASFDVARTTLEFADEGLRREVESWAAALGVGEVVQVSDIDGDTDVVVTLGRDYRRGSAAGGRPGGTGG